MNATELFGLAASFVTLAMISVAVVNGEKTATVIGAGGRAFVNSIKAATLQK